MKKSQNLKSRLTFNMLFLMLTMCSFLIYGQANIWVQTSSPPGGSIWGLASIGSNLFAGASNGGLYFSNDNGVTWTKRNPTFAPNMNVYSVATSGTDLFVGVGMSTSGVYKSSDNGLTWTDVTPTGMGSATNVRSLLIYGGNIYAATHGGQIGIYKSALSGISQNSWATFNTNLGNLDIRSMALDGSNILAGTYGNGVWTSPSSSASWTSLSNGINSSSDYIQALAVNPLTSQSTLFAGNISGSPLMYASYNDGTSWAQTASSAFTKPVYALINNGNKIYAGSEGEGVIESPDNGVTWSSMNIGFKDSGGNWYCNQINVNSFMFAGNVLYAGTDCGVWKYDMGTAVGISEHKTDAISFYPNPAKNKIAFNGLALTESFLVKITNLLGQVMISSPISNQVNEVNISSLENGGVYFVNLLDSKGNFAGIQKLIVE